MACFLSLINSEKMNIKKKLLNDTTIPVYATIALLVIGSLVLKFIADSESRIDY